jgi:hypothetical protein
MFYTYNQNNSFGTFDVNEDVTYYVIVEADSVEDANRRAEGVGIYFDGCSRGRDCPCCGDRWSEAWDGDDATPEPMIYGEPVAEFTPWSHQQGEPIAHVYYKDGSKQEVTK